MKKYILIGIPDCGKSTLGKRVAEILHLPFFDTDSMVSDALNSENPYDFFRAALNGRFLAEEYKAIIKLAKLGGPALIATGAEAALRPECVKLMRNMGTIIHIQRKPELLPSGLPDNDESRIVLYNVKKGTEIDMQKEVVKLYAQESRQYEAVADITMENNGSEDEGIEKLAALIVCEGYEVP
jgi:shikimate kinase